MRKYIQLFLVWLGLLPVGVALSNNISISNISLTGQNTAAGPDNFANFSFVKFDLSWENSWRTNTGTNNWDAAWVFVKYRVAGGVWQHAHLHGNGHQAPTGSTIDVGLLTPGTAFDINTNPGIGAFVYRSANGSGTFSPSNIQLRWNYGSNGVTDNAAMEVRVFAIEMVYVPQGSYYLGDGSSTGTFYTAPNFNTPYEVTAENAAITVGNAAGNLNYSIGGSGCGSCDQAGPIPAAFPKGFNAFYCMKYEIAQLQYVEFLNTLTVSQQSSRTESATNAAPGTGALTSSNANRNGIDIITPSSGSTPAVYACNLNGNTVYNEADDGQWIACNYLSWADLAAYLDWSGLRPMTELEFEKACRGPLTPVANEYAWGSTSIAGASNFTNGGAINETTNTVGANAVYGNIINLQCPIRVGVFATGSSTREQAGSGYYGMMELSGNIWECCVTAGNVTGRTFTGIQGNGQLDATGVSDAPNWPPASAIGAGFRGGNLVNSALYLRISDRDYAASPSSSRHLKSGGRGVRLAP